MSTGRLNVVLTIGGITINKAVTRTGDHPNPYEITIPAGASGTLSTRTNNTAGAVTLTAGHGLVTSDVVDIHWSGGGRYGVTLDDVTNNVGGFDDTPTAHTDSIVLPAQTTAVVVSKQLDINTAIDGDNVKLFGITCDQKARVDMRDAVGDTIKAWDLVADEPQTFDASSGVANPMTGDPITASKASNGTTTAANLIILSLEDSTP